MVAQLEQRTDLRGLLFRSGKPGQFVAGSNLNELAMMSYAMPEQVTVLTDVGHQLHNRINPSPFPNHLVLEDRLLAQDVITAIAVFSRGTHGCHAITRVSPR